MAIRNNPRPGKHRQSLRRNQAKATVTREHWADVWLPRISHFSQFGLFALTLGGLYFTVIPLYQKAALEEQIARKEAESKIIEAALDKGYSRLRLYAVKDYVFHTGSTCTGLLTPPPPLPEPGQSPKPRPSISEASLEKSISACMLDQLGKAAELSDLNPNDKAKFIAQVTELAEELEQKRLASLAEHNSVLVLAEKSPSSLLPPEHYSRGALEFMEARGVNPDVVKKYRLEASIRATQRKIADDFGKYARARISSLRDMPVAEN